MVVLLLLMAGCIRATDVYDVSTSGDGTGLGDVVSTAVPRAGRIEVARFALWAPSVGAGAANIGGAAPFLDGESLVVTGGELGLLPDPSYDRTSPYLSPGPEVGPNEDACITRLINPLTPAIVEYVDVGDRIAIGDEAGGFVLERDPASYGARPGDIAGIGYGGDAVSTPWRSGAALTLSAPGSVPPEWATAGAVPLPFSGAVSLPDALTDVALDGQFLNRFDVDRRRAGPWENPVTFTWEPSPSGEPLTITLRLIATAQETECDACNARDGGCGPGLSCEDGWCITDEGSGWNGLGEVVCTVADDGEFELGPIDLVDLVAYWPLELADGALLYTSRMHEDLVAVPDVRTAVGDRVPVGELRFRATDSIVTRLELP